MAGIADRLRAHGRIDRFGVKLIRNPLGLSERDLLVETCDTAYRTLRCDVIARDAASADLTFIETTWRWRLVEGETQPEVMQECSAGCVAVGESHDPRHRHAGTDNDDNPIYPGPFPNRLWPRAAGDRRSIRVGRMRLLDWGFGRHRRDAVSPKGREL